MRALLLILFFVMTALCADQRQKTDDDLVDKNSRNLKKVVNTVLKSESALPEQLKNEEEKVGQEEHPGFSWPDYTVLAAMLIISCLIGTFYGCFAKKHESSDDFLLGGSDMGTFPMAMSLAASFVTAIELLGNPAAMYTEGTQFWMTCLAFIFVVPITSRLYLPVYMKLRLTSSYEYLNLRFNHQCRVLASGLYMLQMILYTSVAVYAPAVALSKVTSINTYLAVFLVYFVCIFYASQGGMKAVIMTDTFQAAVLIGSLLLILFWGSDKSGGISEIWKYNADNGRIEFFNMDPNPTVEYTFWSVVIGGTFYWTTMFCSNQASVQKYLSVESISQVRKALWVSAIGLIFIYTINFLTGMVLVNVYKDGCQEPNKITGLSSYDELLPFYVIRHFNSAKGVPGFFVAGIFAASLGTVASAMNSLAAIACEDVLQGLFKIKVPARKGAIYAKWISAFFGVLSFALVFVVERLGGVLEVSLTFNGMVGGVTLGLFSLGMFVPWANAKGAMAGAISSLALVGFIGIGGLVASFQGKIKDNFHNGTCPLNVDTIAENQTDEVWPIFKISFLWYSVIGCLGTMLIGIMVSYLTGFQNPDDLDHDLLSPPIRRLIGTTKTKVHHNNNNTLGVVNFGLEMSDEKIKNDNNVKG